MISLRPYQSNALGDLASTWVDLNRQGRAPHILLVSRTGTGKTVVSGEFLRRVRAKGRRAIFVVRDRTLLNQTSAHLDRIGLEEHGVVAAGHPRVRPSAPIQICTVQTCVARGEAPEADVVVLDEAHGALCSTSRQLIDAYPRATLLGLTATPERGDGQPMGDVFDRLVQVRVTFDELVALGALVPCHVIPPVGGKPTRELAEDPVAALVRLAPLAWRSRTGHGHKAVIFAADRKHAAALAEQARAVGYRAADVTGAMKARDIEDRLERFLMPRTDPRAIDVLTNCDLLTQGWDAPPADVGIIARGCSVWSAWIQIVGRFLRPSPATGKTSAVIADLRGSVYIHGHPAEDRDFSLSVSETQREKAAPKPVLTLCKACGACYRPLPACPRCGTAAPPPKPPRVGSKGLREQAVARNAVATYEDRRAYFDKLCVEASKNGWKPGAVGVRFKVRFHAWPPWPIPGAKRRSA